MATFGYNFQCWFLWKVVVLCLVPLMLLPIDFLPKFGPELLLGLVFNDLKVHASFFHALRFSVKKLSPELLAASDFCYLLLILFLLLWFFFLGRGQDTHPKLAIFQADIFIRKMNSIPAFTANLTVESFNRRTLS
jgi:hypothetical protein